MALNHLRKKSQRPLVVFDNSFSQMNRFREFIDSSSSILSENMEKEKIIFASSLSEMAEV